MASPWREVNLPFLETVVSINDRENLYSNDMLYHRKHFWKKKKLNTGCLMIGDAYIWGTLLIKYVDQMKIRNTCIASHKNISETIFMIQLPQ